MSLKFLVLGEGGVFWVLGGGKCRFYFYGRADFSEILRVFLRVPECGSNFLHFSLAPGSPSWQHLLEATRPLRGTRVDKILRMRLSEVPCWKGFPANVNAA